MTVCNMSIEAGARAGLVAPDDTTFAYLEGRQFAPTGKDWDAALDYWRTLPTDAGATFDKEVELDATALVPFVSWGTNPSQVVELSGSVPDPEAMLDPSTRDTATRALEYMGLTAGHADTRRPGRHGLHRFVHQQPHRGSARRRGGGRRPHGEERHACPRRPRAPSS